MKRDKYIEGIITKIENLESLTSGEKRAFILYAMTTDHDGKMSGKVSINTSCVCNEFCEARQNNPLLVCWLCYADALLTMRKGLAEKERIAYIFYNNYKLSAADVPFLNYRDVRDEAYGDIGSVLHFQNLVTIAKKNKHVFFVLWSKNIKLIKNALAGKNQPKNMRIIYSVPRINYIPTIKWYRKLKKIYPFISKVFSVYTADFAEKHNIKINCAGKNCIDCDLCYDCSNRTIFINEILRGRVSGMKQKHNSAGLTFITDGVFSYWKHDTDKWDVVLMDINNKPYGDIIGKDTSFYNVVSILRKGYADGEKGSVFFSQDIKAFKKHASDEEKQVIDEAIAAGRTAKKWAY